jgi:HAD superfamily hydrolase (TIGR01509 family)
MSLDLKNPDFRAAVFDLDGTLFDSMWFWNELDARFLGRHGVTEVPEDYLLAIAHLGAVETAIYTIDRFGLSTSPEEMMSEWHSDAVSFYENEVTLKPGAERYLRMLADKGVKLAVATASSRELYLPGLERCGIRQLFSAFAEVGECERKKGFPDVYELACSRMGASAAETVVFEDILVAVQGAKSGGFRTVGVYDGTSAGDAERIRELADEYVVSFEKLVNS